MRDGDRLVGFIRHAATAWNAEHRIQGHTDVPLSAEGRASLAGCRLPADLLPATWFVSPLARARETAELLGIVEARVEPRLIEMSFGEWEGLTTKEIRAREPRGGGPLGLRPPGGESSEEVVARLAAFLRSEAGRKGPFGAVTHLGIVRAALELAHGWAMARPTPEEIHWDRAHLFLLGEDGRLRPHALNVPFAREAG
ncbi:MAG: histidine phosphatase family protein [Alphaproteobacteria bacterium]|nr:histidine phosphatase family protein [Alphaproteobacteria bacterium]